MCLGSVDTITVSAYSVVDATEEASSVSSQIVDLNLTVDTDGTLTGTVEDDSIITDGLDIIDGNLGLDTILLESGTTLDFSNLTNIEQIDLTANGDHDLGSLTITDVISMTDTNNDLIILGDAGDSLTITASDWTSTDTTTLTGFTIYGNGTTTLTVEDTINDTVIP